MQITLRPYQTLYVQEIVKAFSEGHKRIVLCAPTGSGKTVMFSEMVRRAAFKETSTWVLTDRTELFNQTFAALERVNVKPQLINANTKKHMISPDAIINVGMVETIFRRTGIKPPQLLILDEAHMGNFTKIIEQYPDAFVIGATATPIGKHFYKYYTKLIQCTDVPELIAENPPSLCPCKTIEMQNQDFSDLEMKAGEYTEASNYNHFAKRSLFDGLIEQIHKHIGTRKTIVYCVNVAHANETAALLIEHGFTAKVVTGETPDKEREYTFLGFKYGQFQFLVNVGVATKGYDEPSIEAVIMYLKTNSLAKYLQCVGRGGRTFAGKTYFIHLDFGGNTTAHGTWDEPREWKLEAPKKKQKKKAAPMKICPNCDAMLPAPARVCGFCLHEFVFNSDDELAKGVDVEVTSGQSKKFIGLKVSELSVEELYELSKDPNKKFKSSYIWRIVRSKGELEVEKFAQLAGFKRGWLYRQLEQMQDNDFFDKVIA